jgi:DNA-directed RNA polymerase specialized sigma24 family protein
MRKILPDEKAVIRLFEAALLGDQTSLLALYSRVKFMWHDLRFYDKTGMMDIDDWRMEADLEWFAKWRRWDSSRSSFITYSYTVVYHKLKKIYRDMGVQKRISENSLIHEGDEEGRQFVRQLFYGTSGRTRINSTVFYASNIKEDEWPKNGKQQDMYLAALSDRGSVVSSVLSVVKRDSVLSRMIDLLLSYDLTIPELAAELGVSVSKVNAYRTRIRAAVLQQSAW